MDNLLLQLVLLPTVGALVCTLLAQKMAKWFALAVSVVGLYLAYRLYNVFDAAQSANMQLVLSWPWIHSLNANFALAVDGLSFPLVLLTKFFVPVAILASWHEERKSRAFMICLLVLDAAMTGTFLATDIFLFYVFWEVMLIPMLLIIGVWGSQDRVYASLKFFLYTFAGSVLMLVAIFWLYRSYQHQFGVTSTNIKDYYRLVFDAAPILWGLNTQAFVFLAFTIAFAIKVPLFPLHTWLPDAHVQAPTGGSILLAAVLLKMGTYGILRFSVPICPQAFVQFTPVLVVLSLAGIIYGAWVAFQQTDMKKLVAYSSVSHLGFVTLAICAMNTEALTGGMLQMINHGFSTGALFFIVGALYERRHSRSFSDYGGIAEIVPWLAVFLVFVACSSMAVPGLNGFVGEFLILLGTFKRNPVWAGIAVTGVVFGALYMLWMLKKVLFGGNLSAENKMLKDLDPREWVALVGMGIFIIWLGVAPGFLLKKIDVSMQEYWKHEGKIGMTTQVVPTQKVSVYEPGH